MSEKFSLTQLNFFLDLSDAISTHVSTSGKFMDRTSKPDDVHFWVIQTKKPSEKNTVATSLFFSVLKL